jgi:hypothetical protein
MTPIQIGVAVFSLVSGIVGATVAIESRYEKAAAAESAHELLAAENETDRLRVNLELVKIKLEKFKDLASVRPLSESEQIELRAVEKERDVILERLATKG